MFGVICRLAISSIVNGIWRARNEIKHAGHPHTEAQILKLIIWQVRTRIAGEGKFQKTKENISLCKSWNIDESFVSLVPAACLLFCFCLWFWSLYSCFDVNIVQLFIKKNIKKKKKKI
jgi:hypothetical protein